MSANKGTAAAGFLASGLAEMVTLPVDITKIRLQLQSGTGALQYRGMLDCMAQVHRSEGFLAFWKGGTPAMIRQTCYTSLMMVLFPRVKQLVAPSDGQPLSYGHRLFAGGFAGGVSIAIMNPTEILKTQMQGSRAGGLTMGMVAQKVYRAEGVRGFWSGVQPNVLRCFLVNAAELGTYDQAKDWLVAHNFFPHLPVVQHVTASGVAGVASALTATPADVVKTRLMQQAGQAHEYRSMPHAFVKILQTEGLPALYKGFVPILVRKIVWCTVFFVGYEQLELIFNGPSPR